MSDSINPNDRRRFLQGVAGGAVLGPSMLMLDHSSAADTLSGATANTPHIVTGQITRTSGELLEDGRLLEMQRHIPVAGRSQILVCGAGPAGIGAAIAAARAGAQTQLIEVAGCLGGVWTAGLLTKILDGNNKTGIMQELLTALQARGDTVAKQTGGTVYDPELCKLILEEMCVEAGVKIQLHTRLVGAVKDQHNRLVAIVTESKSGREAWAADRFIDCSGDGDLAAQAGCNFDIGIGTDCECQPMSMLALLTGVSPHDIPQFIRENGVENKARFLQYMQAAGINPSYNAPTLRHLHSGIYSLMTNHEYGVSAIDAGQISAATLRARKEIHEIVQGLKSIGDPWTNLSIVATAEQIGVREGRRIHGRYTVTGEDIISGRRHSDAVCRASFPFDVHNLFPDGTNPEEVKRLRSAGAKPYDIPLGALIAADVDGLMMAGRCISGDFIAHSSYRVTGNAVPMGEAAGRASATSIAQGVMPHELTWI